MSKKALVISGGGSKGAFAVGAIEYMIKTLGLQFDIVAGTSTGALIAPLVITGDIDELVYLYSHVETEQIVKPRVLGMNLFIAPPNSFLETGPIRKLLEQHITDQRAQQIINSDKYMFLTTVSLQTGEIVYFYTGPSLVSIQQPQAKLERITSRRMLIDAALASASMPVFTPPVPIQLGVNTPEQFVDGGVREIAPLNIAIDRGATELFAILLSLKNPAPNPQLFTNVIDILSHTVALFERDVLLHDVRTAQLYSESVRYLKALKNAVKTKCNLEDAAIETIFANPAPNVNEPSRLKSKVAVSIHIIQPEDPIELTEATLVFKPEEMGRVMESGRKRTKMLLGGSALSVIV